MAFIWLVVLVAAGAVPARAQDRLFLQAGDVYESTDGVELGAVGRIYVTTGGSDYYGAPAVAVSVYGGAPLSRLANASISRSITGSCAGAVMRSAPGAPRHLRADIVGRDVALEWENVGGASHFVLDIGFSPGRTDLSIFLGPDGRASFGAVPSGTYYLRLRGGNEFGGGRPSEELRLVVP